MKEDDKRSDSLLTGKMDRRGFLSAAGKVIPTIAIAGLSLTGLAGTVQAMPSDCSHNCTRSCLGGCIGDCKGDCYGTCKGSCASSCTGGSTK